jgi:hypothetical protein
MPRASSTFLNQALDGSNTPTAVLTAACLAIGDPGTTGANENANSGGYVRQTATMAAASAGSKATSGSITWTTGGTVAVTHAFWMSSTTYGAGTYGIGLQLAASVTAASITAASGALTIGAS